MSSRIRNTKSVALTEGATAASVAAAITTALLDLEDRVKQEGRKPIWDTLDIATTEEHVDDSTIVVASTTTYRSVELSVLTVDPQEVQA